MVELGLRSASCTSLRSSSFPRVLASHDNPTGSFFFFKGTHSSRRTIKQRLLSGSSQCNLDRPCCPPLVSHTLFFPLLQCTTCRSKTVSFSISSRPWVPVGQVFCISALWAFVKGKTHGQCTQNLQGINKIYASHLELQVWGGHGSVTGGPCRHWWCMVYLSVY